MRLQTHSSFSSVLSTTAIGLVIFVFVIYVLFQARLLIKGPQVTLVDETSTIQTERQVALHGVAENITDITVNGNPIVTDADGNFEYTIVLENGYNVTSIRAHDRYGRVTKIEKGFVYTPLSLLPK